MPQRERTREIPTPGILIPAGHLVKMGEKLIRGINYVIEHRYISEEYKIGIFFAEEENVPQFVDMVRRSGTVHARGLGISITMASVPEDPMSSIYLIDLWQQIYMYGVVMPKDKPRDIA